jgi:Rhodopirellula transposase DDE domain
VVSAEDAVGVLLADVMPVLDERQRRFAAAAGARVLGRGGIATVARATGMSRSTIGKGIDELAEGASVAEGRVRRPGAGRKRADALDPGLVPALDALVDPESRGDPESPLRWTCKSTRQLAAALTAAGHAASHVLVGELLRVSLGFRLQANAKVIEGKQHPDRDAQFRYINEQVRRQLRSGQPVISVDAKKKELIGSDPSYKNAGREWRPKGSPERVGVHDFPDPDLPKAIPYGVYDLKANEGFVVVGQDGNTASFAAETLRRWWAQVGSVAYPNAKRLLICADAGGSNGYRLKLWKVELARLAAETGLQITVCHFPPGTSKWNRIEHRLFSAISMNWRGRPLTSHEVVVELIGATTTRTGLKVRAEHDTGTYPTGVKVTDKELAAVPLKPHKFHGEWNYTVTSQSQTVGTV